MNTDSHGFSGKEDDLTHEIIGSAFEVLNTLGVGLLEKPYENALAIDKITKVELAQMLNYLRITRLKVGLILNFKRPKLEFERLVLDS